MANFDAATIVSPLPTDELLIKQEQIWRVNLPETYKDFIKIFNGVEPKQATVKYNSNSEIIERFLCILNSAEDNQKAAMYDIDVVIAPRIIRLVYDGECKGIQVLPIAKMEHGNFLALNYKGTQSNPTVCVWDNEESDDFAPVVYFVANSFDEFFDTLEII